MEAELRTHQKLSDLGDNESSENTLQGLPRESKREVIDRYFDGMTRYSPNEATKLDACSEKLVTAEFPILKLAEAILKTRDPRIKNFDWDVGSYPLFKASFNKLEKENIYSEDELLDLLLTHVTGMGRKLFKGFLQKCMGITSRAIRRTNWNSVSTRCDLKKIIHTSMREM